MPRVDPRAAAVSLATALLAVSLVYPAAPAGGELANRIPEPAPYVTGEAAFAAPPFEDYWMKANHPAQCQTCHQRIFAEWKGSMMANAWRDPAWRAAFLLSARQISTHGNCDTPNPPDGTAKARHNPFAGVDECVTRFDLGDGTQRLARGGSLVDGFCSRCHMPTNYVDNVPLHGVTVDAGTGIEHGALDVHFNPTSDNATGLAFATLDAQLRNTDSGKNGVVCMVCHSLAETRNTPYHNQARAAHSSGYAPTRNNVAVPEPDAPNLGYSTGAGSYRLSPHAIAFSERLGPLSSPDRAAEADTYLAGVFKRPAFAEPMASPKHEGFRHVLATRAEFCSTCHDVTNSLTIRNVVGKWVGGFPIERTYAEWAGSRYADRPGNVNFNPAFKRDCQTCHMQQDYGQPGTAQTLYKDGAPVPPLAASLTADTPERTYFSHHFIGGNAYIPRLLGASLDDGGGVEPYPELSTFSFSSADETSKYHNAFWLNTDRRGAQTQQARLAWDRLRNVLDLTIAAAPSAAAGSSAPIGIAVANTGSGHNFPTGFPEGRIAWLAVSAFDLSTGRELLIHDAFWNRSSVGVGRLTTEETIDPAFPGCGWKLPEGSPDPYSYQFKAVATRGDDCPTLELVYATARNLVTNAAGLPVDARGTVIDKRNPLGKPIFRDLDGDGDLYDDAFLRDTRLRPMPHPGATVRLDRYAVVIPPGTRGPIAVTAAVYYQSIEAIVAKKFLGNLADTNMNRVLEPCVLGGRCDGRRSSVEPPVVEGAPPVPMEVRSVVIRIDGEKGSGAAPSLVAAYPRPDAADVFLDVVPKASFSEPVTRVDAATFTLSDAAGDRVPASVHQIGDGTWGLFPDRVFLTSGETYTARIAAGVCGTGTACTTKAIEWKFTVAARPDQAAGDTTIPAAFKKGSR